MKMIREASIRQREDGLCPHSWIQTYDRAMGEGVYTGADKSTDSTRTVPSRSSWLHKQRILSLEHPRPRSLVAVEDIASHRPYA